MTFDDFLIDHLALCQEAYGVDPRGLEGEAFARYLRDNVLAATDELHEALRETDWKTWSSKQGRGNHPKRFQKELVDVFFFWGNLVLLAGIDGETLTRLYREKSVVNRKRRLATAHVEEVAVEEPAYGGVGVCRICGADYNATAEDFCSTCLFPSLSERPKRVGATLGVSEGGAIRWRSA